MNCFHALLAGVFALCWFVGAPAARADVVTIVSGRDVTLYENDTGDAANGSGEHFFAGRTNAGEIRRGILWFDIASAVPPGSTITDVTLRLRMSKTIVGGMTTTLHRVQRAWGEGASNAFGQEGGGTNPERDDATWIHTFYPDQFWKNMGGDFDAAVISSLAVGPVAFYTWPSTPEFVSLAQSWLDDPSANFGLMVITDETQFPSAKRFDSHENGVANNRPMLQVTFDPPAATAELVDATVTFGQLLGGTVDDLRESDDQRITTRSSPGISVLEPDLMQIEIGAVTSELGAATLDVTIESGLNHPTGVATLRLRNWNTNQLQVVGSYPLTSSEQTVTTEDISTTNRIRQTDGRIDLAIRHVVPAVFSALGFDSRIDLVEILPQ